MKTEVSVVWDMTFFSLVQIYTTVLEKYVVFVTRVAYSEDRGSRILRNVGKFLLDYTASHSKKNRHSPDRHFLNFAKL